jgi:hypothetical protein
MPQVAVNSLLPAVINGPLESGIPLWRAARLDREDGVPLQLRLGQKRWCPAR